MIPNLVLPAEVISSYAVYGWYRKGEGYLYIGQSISLIRRLRNHHVVKMNLLESDDEFHIWYCAAPGLNQLERVLIKKHNPLLNKRRYDVKPPDNKHRTFQDAFFKRETVQERARRRYGYEKS